VNQANGQHDIFRFGIFEADLSTGELRRRGRVVRLQEQPFQVLALLLARPGELVMREEMRQALWPADTFVDFEHGLNKAISKLRHALGDDSGTPRYIETLPRRGYRFIAPVTIVATPKEAVESPKPATQSDLSGNNSAPKTQWRTYATVLSLGLVVMLTSWVLFKLFRKRAHPAGEAISAPIRSLAVLPLKNLSGDKDQEYFADGMTDELITDLGQMSALRVISRTSVMGYKQTSETLPPLPQIGRELGADAIVEGTVSAPATGCG
jgi:DNA-binding winged helix-turn-helix (wHTH) protein